MATLQDVTQAVAKEIHDVVNSEASTAGAAGKTTLVDTSGVRPDLYGINDYFNNGTICFNTGGATSNDGASAIITDYASATNTFTFAAQSYQTQSGDDYCVWDKTYPRHIIWQYINAAYAELPYIPQEYEDSSYITVADQMNYDFPTDVFNILEVYIATSTSAPYEYRRHLHWRPLNDDISFDEGYQPQAAGYRIRLVYAVPPSELTADTSAISSYVDINWLKWTAAAKCLDWRYRKVPDRPALAASLLKAIARAEEMAANYKPLLFEVEPDIHASPWMTSRTTRSDAYDGTVRLS